ncbi:MAG: ATP-binding protein [Acidimicrobiales bacterium]
MALIPRLIEAELRDILGVSRAAAIVGPREVGKSTVAKQLQSAGVVPNYFSLDDQTTLAAARSDPDGLVLSLPRPCVIDEIQRVPELMLAIKQVLDRDLTPGQFLLTGSADLVASNVVADALPGRVEYVNLWPLSQAEIAGRSSSLIDALFAGDPPRVVSAPKGRSASSDVVLAGGFPDARLRRQRQRVRYFRSYVETILGRDLREIGEIRIDSSKLEQLLRLLAARTSGTANFSALGRDLVLAEKTVRAHCELLRQLFLLYRLQPFSINLGSRQVKTPKLFLTDTGMAAALIGVDEDRYCAPDQGGLAEMLLETFVVMEFVKQSTWNRTPVQLFFYRDKERREVDLVLESASGDIVGIEVKSSSMATAADANGLRLLRDKLGSRFKIGVVVYSGENTLPLGERIWAMPLKGLWA